MSGGALARMRPGLGIGALAPRRAAASGWRRPGAWHTRLAGVVVLAAGAAAGYAGQGLIPGAGVGPLQALPLARIQVPSRRAW